MNNYDRQYETALANILYSGSKKSDRTGTGTTSLFGLQMRWNLAHVFPLITTKRVYTRPMVEELLWFLSGDTNEHTLRDKGVNIWRDWATAEQCSAKGRADGDLGPVYGSLWREWPANHVTLVTPRELTQEDPVIYPIWAHLESRPKVRANSLAGEERESAQCGRFRILREYRIDGVDRNVYDIQFLKTGFIKSKVQHPQVKEGAAVKDPYYPGILGVACFGEVEVGDDLFERGLYQQWFSMLRRCYDQSHPGFENYGGKGVFVCNQWLNFAQFRKDVERLPRWRERRLNPTGTELDKDYYSGNCYSPDTCVWLSQAENTAYTGYAVEAKFPSGEVRRYLSYSEAARALGVSEPTVAKYAPAGGTTAKGVGLFKLEGPYRRVTHLDQIAELIGGLRADPEGRRHIITAWNPAFITQVALPACHCLFQFYVADGKLSCQLYQRSADMFLGTPFNIASYALLTHMVAQQVGLAVGEFIWTGGDCHIYDNHQDQVRLQISRAGFNYPKLALKPAPSIFDYTLDHVGFVDYQYDPAIPAPVAV